MISRLTLTDYRCHRRLVLDLAPGLNVLVGGSDVGKSSVVESLGWLAFNRPPGDRMVRSGSKRAKASAEVDGRTVARVRGPNANVYKLDGETLKAPGAGVPDPVADLLNLGEVNFALQLDPVFWFALSPGEVSRQLNQIVNLDLIDRTLANLAARLRRVRSEQAVVQDRLESAEAERQKLAWVPAAVQAYAELDAISGEMAKNSLKRSQLADLLGDESDCGKAIKTQSRRVKALESAVRAGERTLKTQKRRDALTRLMGDLDRADRAAAAGGPAAAVLADLERRVVANRSKRAGLARLLGQLAAAEVDVRDATGEQRRTETELHKLAGSGPCPLCGNPRTEN